MMNKKDYIRLKNEELKLIAMDSPDPNSKCACIITSSNGVELGVGFNHFPSGCEDFSWSNDPHQDILNTKYPYVIHAELDAIFSVIKTIRGKCNIETMAVPTIAFVTFIPCNECAKALIEFGIKEIIYYKKKDEKRYNFDATFKMCKSAGVKLSYYKELINE